MAKAMHADYCAYAGLPLSERGQLPWPAGEGDMCVCSTDRPTPSDYEIVPYLRNNVDIDFEFVALGGTRRAGDPPRWFLADYRDQSGYPEPWVCIHQWTASPASLLRNLSWTTRNGGEPKIWIFEARNKGQIAFWLETYGYKTRHMGKREAPMPAQERIIVNSRERHIEAAQHTIARAQAKIDRLMGMPDEPTTDDPDGALAVWFLHRFGPTGQFYTYAAVKAGDGKWYATGPASPKGYSWDELVTWHFTEVNQDCPMYVATEWDVVS